jgi:hypothetical protein
MVFLLSMVVTNVWYMNRVRIGREDAAAIARLSPLRSRMKPGSLVTILSNQDELETILNRNPFDPINRPTPFRLYDAIEPATARIAVWRSQFAAEAFAAWSRGGEVWISQRLRAPVPLPAWNWVEGDDKRISWREIAAFFVPLREDAEAGGPDGFVRLAPDPESLARLNSVR